MWGIIFTVLTLTTLSAVADHSYDTDYDPYIDIPLRPLKSTADRIREHGYPAESHFVETSDHYVLNIFRIPYSPKLNNQNERRPAVLIQHGLLSCSDCFVLNGPEDAIAFNFADAGFDVWLGNARGNIYSRNNTKISLKHPYFWDFSWHEIGAIDIPEMIDYILSQTGEEGLHYVGHSQGGTSFFVLGSVRAEYNKKIKTANLLAPVVFNGNATEETVNALAPYVGTPGLGANLLSSQEFLPANPFVQRLLDTACGSSPSFAEYCQTLFMMWGGENQPNLNETLLPQLPETHPAGISTNQGIHYIQNHVSNKFRQYDHGVKKNMRKYNQVTPPDYPLEKITANTFIYYGLADTSANKKDILRLPDYLQSITIHEVPNPTWGHLDFIFGLKVKEVINDPVINVCKQYEEYNNGSKFKKTLFNL